MFSRSMWSRRARSLSLSLANCSARRRARSELSRFSTTSASRRPGFGRRTKGKIGAVTLLDHVRLPNPGLLVVTSLQPGGKRATGPKEHDEDRTQEVQEDLKHYVLPPPSSPQSPGGRSRCPWPPPWLSTQAGP